MFLERLLSSVVLVIVLAVSLFFGGNILFLLCLFLAAAAYWEMVRATRVVEKNGRMNGPEIVGMLGVIGYYGVRYFADTETYIMLAITLTLIGIMFVYVFSFPKYHANQVMSAVFAFLYAPIMLSYIYLTRNLKDGIYLVWLIFISSWICDTCAYLVGMLIGKHKMAPKLSPKKSVEGAIGGVAGAFFVGVLYGYVLAHFGFLELENILLIGVIAGIGGIISQIGDLAASAVKRNFSIKDYGKLIPGHGGIMDRFDSVMFTAPMVYYLAVLLLNRTLY
ncbi:MAG: phosphatidate cytidylyltransferase [Lachnospiraceae bacterium]|nr:phosphatidate cytidylyltransferase [Lachnospiraceae bacterium]